MLFEIFDISSWQLWAKVTLYKLSEQLVPLLSDSGDQNVSKKQHFSMFYFEKLPISFAKTKTTSVIIDMFKKYKLDDEVINCSFEWYVNFQI